MVQALGQGRVWHPQGSCHLSALPDLGTRGSCHRRSPAVRAWAVRGLLGVSAGHSGSKTPCRPHSRLRLTPEERRAVGSTALFPVASWWVPRSHTRTEVGPLGGR